MNRKGRVFMDEHLQVLHMQEKGFSQNAIASTLKMCPKTAPKHLKKNPFPDKKSSRSTGKVLTTENHFEYFEPHIHAWIK
jgi:transcriptional regulator